jgi:alkanesulfonate monooxygenase SsuD/methylene tetrahydromethanopterin reductase-like flavin-dependent oxidoreductase (luciferase family)
VRRALYVAPFGELSDPKALVELAVAAEGAGWDGLFLWDHIWRPPERSTSVGDAWIALAAIAACTTRIRIGPMVVPLSRRRPQKVARESVALDHLSEGRLTLGVGLGVDTSGELRRFGETSDDVARAAILDEALDVLLALWSGEEVHHVGPRFTADGVRFLPTARQQPRIPVWGAARGTSGDKPLRRAARLDGLFPVGTSHRHLRRMLDVIGNERGSLDGFDVALVDADDTTHDLDELGVTWRIQTVREGETRQQAMLAASSTPG